MGNWYQFIIESVGALGIATGSIASIALIVWGVFKILSIKWLDAKFEARLASYKHAQDRELEDLRFQISTQLDRLTKLHQHEFDILPEAWRRCIKAYYGILALVSQLQTFPDLDRMNEKQLDEFLDEATLANWQKDEIRIAREKNKEYREALFWLRLQTCRNHYFSSREYLVESAIFISPVIAARFERISDLSKR